MSDSAPLRIEYGLLTAAEWRAVAAIYSEGIETGHATFAASPPSWQDFDASKLPEHRWVARTEGGVIAGWAALSAVSRRCVYRGVAEVSLYVQSGYRSQGVGASLMEHTIRCADQGGIWTIQAQIFPENTASLLLHERAGFRVVGVQEKLGKMTYGPLAGMWRDVVLLERRSGVSN